MLHVRDLQSKQFRTPNRFPVSARRILLEQCFVTHKVVLLRVKKSGRTACLPFYSFLCFKGRERIVTPIVTLSYLNIQTRRVCTFPAPPLPPSAASHCEALSRLRAHVEGRTRLGCGTAWGEVLQGWGRTKPCQLRRTRARTNEGPRRGQTRRVGQWQGGLEPEDEFYTAASVSASLSCSASAAAAGEGDTAQARERTQGP